MYPLMREIISYSLREQETRNKPWLTEAIPTDLSPEVSVTTISIVSKIGLLMV
jgi:hypothetical protein